MRYDASKPRPEAKILRISLEFLIVFILCFALIRMVEAMSASWDLRTKFGTFLLLLVSPGIFYGVIQFITREVRAFRLFLECMIATGLLGLFFPESNILGTLWLLPACFGLAALLVLIASCAGKRRRRKWTVLPDLKRLPRKEAIGGAREASLEVEEARQRLAMKLAERAASVKKSTRSAFHTLLLEAVRAGLVFGLFVGLHFLCLGVHAISSPMTDLSGSLFLILYPPVLCGLLIWITKEVGPGRVLLFLTFTYFILGAVAPEMVDRSLSLFLIFCFFGMGFIITVITRANQTLRLAALRAVTLEDPAIVHAPSPGGAVPENEMYASDGEKREEYKRRSAKKFRSQRQHTRWYRHPWFSR